MNIHDCTICGSKYTRRDKLLAHGLKKHPNNSHLFQKRKLLTEAERKQHKKQLNLNRYKTPTITKQPPISRATPSINEGITPNLLGMIDLVPITETLRFKQFLLWKEQKLQSIAIARGKLHKLSTE